jgi:putative oxidoreductase
MIAALRAAHRRTFGALQESCEGWFLETAARLVFLAVLFRYYFHSAILKLGEGWPGLLLPDFGAYIQILGEQTMAQHDMETASVPLYLDLVVYTGTYAEIVLPALVVAGLFTRLAALGMIVFVAVQTYVDIRLHGVDDSTAGALFDRDPGAAIADQRMLWIFLLAVLVVRGGGIFSLDHLLARIPAK